MKTCTTNTTKKMKSQESIQHTLLHKICQTANEIKKIGSLALRAAQCNVPPEQYYLLCILQKKKGINQQKLSQKVSKDVSNIARLLNSLEKRELIKRLRNKADRRSYQTFLTPKGVELIKKFHSRYQQSSKLLEQYLTEKEQEFLSQVLQKTNNVLDEFKKTL